MVQNAVTESRQNLQNEVLSCGSFGLEGGSQALRERKLKYKSKPIEDSQNLAAI